MILNKPRIMDITNGDEINLPAWVETIVDAEEWIASQDISEQFEIMAELD